MYATTNASYRPTRLMPAIVGVVGSLFAGSFLLACLVAPTHFDAPQAPAATQRIA